jgi:DNA topoisomerase IB
VDGDRVSISFTGKSGQLQRHVIENAAVAAFFRRLLREKAPDDPVFSPRIYRSVFFKFKSDTGLTIKDLRTAMAHLIVPEAKKEWMEAHGRPATKAQEKKMISYAINKAAAILGNKPGIVRKSYANPEDLKPGTW